MSNRSSRVARRLLTAALSAGMIALCLAPANGQVPRPAFLPSLTEPLGWEPPVLLAQVPNPTPAPAEMSPSPFPAASGEPTTDPAGLQLPPAAPPRAANPPRTTWAAALLGMARSLGVWAIPFALLTLIAVWFTTERLVVLRRGRVIPKPFVQRFLKLLADGEMERDYALQVCEENGSPVALVFAHGVRKWGKPSVEVEQAIIDGGERQVATLRKHLRVINGVASVSPLLGLLGTVWGMLDSFNQIAAAGAMGKVEQLAGGIALALVTTAAGLAIAIPALISYMYLVGRVDALVMEMDDLAQRVVQHISAEAFAEQANRPRPRKEAEPTRKRATV